MVTAGHGAMWKAYKPEYLSENRRQRYDGMEYDDILVNILEPLLKDVKQRTHDTVRYEGRNILQSSAALLQHLTEDAHNIATYLLERTCSDYEF